MATSESTAHGSSTERLVRDDIPVADPIAHPVPAAARETVPRRKPILAAGTDQPAPASAAPAPTSYIVKSSRPANQRRGKPVLKLLALIFLANVLLVGAFGAWYYNTINDRIEQRLGRTSASSRPAPPSATAATPSSNAGLSAELASLNDKVADLQAQLLAAQKRLADAEQASKAIVARLARSTPDSRLPAATPATSLVEEAPGAAASSAPLNDDLLLLKERNRLTAYADEAIATAARAPYDQLWKALDDPRLANLVHAARSEILRVQNYYLSGSRLDRFDIPVGDYYPDSAALRDAQLNDEQLIRLLSNAEHPWQVRLKAANLLGTRRSTTVGDALVQTIKTDTNLDVIKEATFSFEQITGYHAQLFETKAVEAWWKQYNESPQPAAMPNSPEAAPPPAVEKPKADVDKKTAKPPEDKAIPELKLPEANPATF